MTKVTKAAINVNANIGVAMTVTKSLGDYQNALEASTKYLQKAQQSFIMAKSMLNIAKEDHKKCSLDIVNEYSKVINASKVEPVELA